MTWFSRVVNRKRLEQELDAELHFHFDAAVAENAPAYFIGVGLKDGTADKSTAIFGTGHKICFPGSKQSINLSGSSNRIRVATHRSPVISRSPSHSYPADGGPPVRITVVNMPNYKEPGFPKERISRMIESQESVFAGAV